MTVSHDHLLPFNAYKTSTYVILQSICPIGDTIGLIDVPHHGYLCKKMDVSFFPFQYIHGTLNNLD